MVASQDLGVKEKLREKEHPAEKGNQSDSNPRRGRETRRLGARRPQPGAHQPCGVPRLGTGTAYPTAPSSPPTQCGPCLLHGAELGDPGGFTCDVSPGPCCLTVPLRPSPPQPLGSPALSQVLPARLGEQVTSPALPPLPSDFLGAQHLFTILSLQGGSPGEDEALSWLLVKDNSACNHEEAGAAHLTAARGQRAVRVTQCAGL